MMRSVVLAFFLAAGCGPPPQAGGISVPFPLTRAECKITAATVGLKARVLFEGFATPCDLKVAQSGAGDISATGDCIGVPLTIGTCGPAATCATAKTPADCRALNNTACTWGSLITLQWIVTSPAPANRDIVLGEAYGRANVSEPEPDTIAILVEFKETNPAHTPKTKAKVTDSTGDRDKFNCDRGGANFCTKTDAFPTVTTDADTCSNLEELCNGTLFSEASNACP